jgi:hypothetical protein
MKTTGNLSYYPPVLTTAVIILEFVKFFVNFSTENMKSLLKVLKKIFPVLMGLSGPS